MDNHNAVASRPCEPSLNLESTGGTADSLVESPGHGNEGSEAKMKLDCDSSYTLAECSKNDIERPKCEGLTTSATNLDIWDFIPERLQIGFTEGIPKSN